MSMYLDIEAVKRATNSLDHVSQLLTGAHAAVRTLNPAPFSVVSGLDQAGQMHQAISSVSEPEATRGLAQFFASAAELLHQQVDGFVSVDAGIGESFRSAAGNVSSPVALSPLERPQSNPFHVAFPVAGRPANLEVLVSQLAATDFTSMFDISQNWFSTASVLVQALGELPGAMGLLSTSAETDAIHNAIANVEFVDVMGRHYAAKSHMLGSHTGGLATLSQATAVEAAAALGAVRSTADPVASKSLEEVFLSTFGPRLTTQLAPTVPTFESLLPPMKPGSSHIMDDGAAHGGVPEFTREALPQVVNKALAHTGWGDLTHATTPAEIVEQVGKPNPDMLDLIASGATPTQVASATAPSLPPVGALGGALTGGAGASASASASALTGSAAGAVGGLGGAMPLAGRGAAGLNGGVGAGGRAGAGAGGSGALGVRGGFSTPPGTGGGAGTGGVGPAPGNGAGAGTGGVGAGSPGANPRTGGAAGITGGGYGMGPAAGAGRGGRNGQQKRGRVQAVTSAVEREGNLKALLGEAPEVVPGVIGAWVREPKR
ncbi:hypothetical protein F4V54_03720 [Corynebacterium tuscaniense]|uniref:hypothetical protein n=1 Tax=Corynebacterium tuscaniense TaxID=302449 RepID=UPI00123AD82D|nr:hypothetical protein [Corynebacterium tuscaniense]KAA8742633.1 hypothetical protein F4V54_03720 [Corynebacterium tuscaniense]